MFDPIINSKLNKLLDGGVLLEKTIVLEETTVSANDALVFALPNDVEFGVYTVYVNGTKYEVHVGYNGFGYWESNEIYIDFSKNKMSIQLYPHMDRPENAPEYITVSVTREYIPVGYLPEFAKPRIIILGYGIGDKIIELVGQGGGMAVIEEDISYFWKALSGPLGEVNPHLLLSYMGDVFDIAGVVRIVSNTAGHCLQVCFSFLTTIQGVNYMVNVSIARNGDGADIAVNVT